MMLHLWDFLYFNGVREQGYTEVVEEDSSGSFYGSVLSRICCGRKW